MRFLALLAFICLFASLCSAQVPKTNGCYVAPNRIYTSTNCTTSYYVLTCDGSDPDNEVAVRTGALGATCSVCSGMLGTGKRTNYTVYHCPLDTGVIFLALLSVAVGLYFLKLRKMQLFY